MGARTLVVDGRRKRKVSDDRILEAATIEFANHGFAGASMQAIADGARTTKATIYANIGDKDALYRAAVVAETASLRSTLLGAYASVAEEPVPDQLRIGIAAIFTFAEERPDGFRLLLGEGPDRTQPEALIARTHAEVVNAVSLMVAPRLHRAGVTNVNAAQLIAAILVGMFRAAATHTFLHGDVNHDAAIEVAHSLASAALAGFDIETLKGL